MKNYLVRHAVALALLSIGGVSLAGPVNGLVGFTSGTPAKAAEVNANFNAVKSAVDDNDARLKTLEAKIAALEARLASVSLVTLNGQPTVRFSGVNLQVVNGQGRTISANGTGNLIIGYDEGYTSSGIYLCTVGSDLSTLTAVTDSAMCIAAGGIWTNDSFKSGSHNIVVGPYNNYSSIGGVVFGEFNTSSSQFTSVLGGTNNIANGYTASVSGGGNNTASGYLASVSGGNGNKASGENANVSGGAGNTASGYISSVGGGINNTAGNNAASVSGGTACNVTSTGKWAVGLSSTTGCSSTLSN